MKCLLKPWMRKICCLFFILPDQPANRKGVVHSCAGYMIYTTYSFVNVFQYKPGDIYFCTADVGWITGHSYTIYGPLSAGATTYYV